MVARPELTGRKFAPKTAVATRYTVSTKTVDRWVKRGILPPPALAINNRKYWDEAALDERDRGRAAEQARQPATPLEPLRP